MGGGNAAEEHPGRGRARPSTLGSASGVDPEFVLPLVDHARWSTNVEVRESRAGPAAARHLVSHSAFPPQGKNKHRVTSHVCEWHAHVFALGGECEGGDGDDILSPIGSGLKALKATAGAERIPKCCSFISPPKNLPACPRFIQQLTCSNILLYTCTGEARRRGWVGVPSCVRGQ